MKLCAACRQTLPKESFSKNQWQLRQYQRRCKECIGAHREVTLQSPKDEALFKQPPPREVCPICFLTLPVEDDQQEAWWKSWRACCGKIICCGCMCEVFIESFHRGRICPFCRAPPITSEEEITKRIRERAKSGDPIAIHRMGQYYFDGSEGFPEDKEKALELYLHAGDLGSTIAYFKAGVLYDTGQGVKRNKRKAKYYYELAAMGGDVFARHNLGCIELDSGKMSRAVKHFMIAAGAGYDDSLKSIRDCFMQGHATKDELEKAQCSHKQAQDEMRSDQRDLAVRVWNGFSGIVIHRDGQLFVLEEGNYVIRPLD